MKKKRMNNKGFSLVELIVVIAIMAILAVTLAPKLMQYVDSAKVASDKNAVNSIFDATRLTLVDSDYYNAFTAAADVVPTTTGGTSAAYYVVSLEDVFTVTADNKWSVKSSYADGFYSNLTKVLGNFQLKSTSAKATTLRAATDSDIIIVYNVSTKVLSACLLYGGYTAPVNAVDMVTLLGGATINYSISE